jgi:hypothetical protein
LAARLLGRTPCERPVIDAMACAISAVVGAFSLTVSVRFVGRSVEHEQSCVAKIYVARSRRRHLIWLDKLMATVWPPCGRVNHLRPPFSLQDCATANGAPTRVSQRSWSLSQWCMPLLGWSVPIGTSSQ